MSEIQKQYVADVKQPNDEKVVIRMNQLTAKVLELQKLEVGSVERDLLFADIYESVKFTMEGIVNGYSFSLKGDVHEGLSEALNHLVNCCESFKYEGFEFLTFYKKTLKNKMIDLVRKLNAEKVRHNTSYDFSLSVDVQDGEGSTYSIEDRFQDESLQVNDSYNIEKEEVTLSSILDKFAEVKPFEAGVIEIMLKYSAEGYQKKDLTSALATYYGLDTYNSTVQKRVSRVRETFKKFAIDNGFAM
jgi:hypothetical protein